MSESQSNDALLCAFEAVATAGVALTPICIASLYKAVTDISEDMRLGGASIERVIVRIKTIASEAGVRETHARLVTSAVLWAIDYYYREDSDFVDAATSVGSTASTKSESSR